MKVASPWQCDRCRTYRQSSNHWFIGSVSKGVHIQEWSDTAAKRNGTRHLCGIRCATAFVQEELGKMVGGTVQKATASPSAATFPPSPNEAAELEAIQKAGFDRAQSVPRLDVDIGDPNAPDEGWEGFGGKTKL